MSFFCFDQGNFNSSAPIFTFLLTWYLSGRQAAPVGAPGMYVGADFSPDGNWIAYVCRTQKEYKLCVISPDGQKRMQLTTGPGVDDSPSWSPDGRHIVFQSHRTGTDQIFSMLADGTNVKQLTTSGNNSQPNWSWK